MMQVIKMTNEEKFKIYMEVPHEELVRMKIEEEKLMEIMENERPQYYSTKPLFTLTAEEVEIVESILFGYYQSLIIQSRISSYENMMVEKTDNLLTRIKQWQDENNRTD